MLRTKTIQLLEKHEGLKLKPYLDTKGKLTIGIGRNLDDNGISIGESYILLNNDIENWVMPALYDLFDSFDDFSENRQNALISMMFNLGEPRFKGFKKMIASILAGKWEDAAKESLNSKWAKDVGKRADEIALMLKKG